MSATEDQERCYKTVLERKPTGCGGRRQTSRLTKRCPMESKPSSIVSAPEYLGNTLTWSSPGARSVAGSFELDQLSSALSVARIGVPNDYPTCRSAQDRIACG